jgi:hypothetical protein
MPRKLPGNQDRPGGDFPKTELLLWSFPIGGEFRDHFHLESVPELLPQGRQVQGTKSQKDLLGGEPFVRGRGGNSLQMTCVLSSLPHNMGSTLGELSDARLDVDTATFFLPTLEMDNVLDSMGRLVTWGVFKSADVGNTWRAIAQIGVFILYILADISPVLFLNTLSFVTGQPVGKAVKQEVINHITTTAFVTDTLSLRRTLEHMQVQEVCVHGFGLKSCSDRTPTPTSDCGPSSTTSSPVLSVSLYGPWIGASVAEPKLPHVPL